MGSPVEEEDGEQPTAARRGVRESPGTTTALSRTGTIRSDGECAEGR